MMLSFTSVVQSVRDGMAVLLNKWTLWLYGVVSIASVYQLIVYHSIISQTIGEGYRLIFITLLFSSNAISILFGAIWRNRIGRNTHVLWNLLGIVYAVLLMAGISDLRGLITYSVLGGIVGGLCIPDVICSILELTKFENRGSVSGIFIFFVYLQIFSSSLFIRSRLDLVVFLLVLKFVAIALLQYTPLEKSELKETVSIKHPLRVSLLYGLVWFLFLLVDIIASNIALKALSSEEIQMINLEALFLGITAMLVGGAVMDNIGRRRLIIGSYLYLGVEYSFISLSSGSLIRYTFIDGIAWGILTVVFLMVVWGDLVISKRLPLYLAISLIIALATIYVKNIIPLLGLDLEISQTFPLTSIFLFISVFITAFLLPETLPEKVIQSKELRDYIETAKKIKEKYR